MGNSGLIKPRDRLVKRIIQKTKLNKTSVVGLVAFFVVTGVFYIVLSRAATVVPTLGFYFNPTTTTVNQGSSFTVQVMANTGGYAIQSAAARVYYDNSKLQLTKANDITTGIDPAWEIRTSCSVLNNVTVDGVNTTCKSAGEIVYLVGNSDPANLRPAGNYVLGNMTFTVRPGASVGQSDITFDNGVQTTTMVNPDSTAQTELNKRSAQKGTITIQSSSSGGGGSDTTPPAGGGTTSPNNQSGGSGAQTSPNPASGTGTGSTRNNTSAGGSSSGASGSPSNTATNVYGTPVNSQQVGESSPVASESAGQGPETISKPMLIVASAGLAFMIVGTIMAAFSAPVRNAVMGVGHVLHHPHIQPAGHVMVGGPSPNIPLSQPTKPIGQAPTSPVNPIQPISQLDPPKTTNTTPSHAGIPGKIIEPTKPPTEG